ncbi:MAG TPA: dihydropteroate synthase [Planctomycetota bacterium]|nr:dihydropteroate synthase [Planctomycetota bacterium]
MVSVFGIVNITRDSFSDGGRFVEPDAALAHAGRLLAHGANVIDLGAESTHPDAEDVPEAEEIRRLQPVVEALLQRGVEVSIDTCKARVMRAMTALGVHWLNDVHGFRDGASLAAAAEARDLVRFVFMFSRSRRARADRPDLGEQGLVDELRAFLDERLAAFAAAGIARERLVFDPGMGFFLGRTPSPSLTVLKHLRELAGFGVPLLVSASRKSFLGELTGLPVGERGPATLAAELWAVRNGAAYVRTHDVAALRAALAVESAIEAAR